MYPVDAERNRGRLGTLFIGGGCRAPVDMPKQRVITGVASNVELGHVHPRLPTSLLANVNSRSSSLYAIARLSVACLPVCRLSSVTFVHPSQPVQILGNVSMPFGILAIH